MSARRIEIVGGGLAGLALGIFLQRRGVDVVVHEAGRYPRHRVCGEFLSPRDAGFLSKCGLEDIVQECAAGRAISVLWEWAGAGAGVGRFTLNEPAWRVSRYVLDARLARELVAVGGRLICGARVEQDAAGREGLVWAAGRRRATQCGWVGVKLHLRGVQLRADLEMITGRGAYVGLCQVGENEVNVSGLFRASNVPGGKERGWPALLRSHGLGGLCERLAGNDVVEGSFCAVSHLDFSTINRGGADRCAVGDAFGMIAPLTGNGMSVALESAWLASEPLVDYAEGRRDWAGTCAEVRRRLSRAFALRMRVARLCQWLLCAGWTHAPLSAAAQSGLVPWGRLYAVLGS